MKQTSQAMPKKSGASKKTKFSFYSPQAEKVQLAGSFNGWDPKQTSLTKNKKGEWSVSLPLQPGRYEYRYLVDGDWQNDQQTTECVPNAFGTWNCVIRVQ